MCVKITFESIGGNYSVELTTQAWEAAMMCTMDSDDYPFTLNGYCTQNECLDNLWSYLMYYSGKSYDVINYERAYINACRVEGYSSTAYCEYLKNNLGRNKKRKREDG